MRKTDYLRGIVHGKCSKSGNFGIDGKVLSLLRADDFSRKLRPTLRESLPE